MEQTLDNLKKRHSEFCDARDWDQFHSPKNLSMALVAETAEIVEILQWLTEDESRNLPDKKQQHMRDEIGDVLIYLVRLADRLGIDPVAAAFEKMEKNGIKYPVEKSKGNALKYTEH